MGNEIQQVDLTPGQIYYAVVHDQSSGQYWNTQTHAFQNGTASWVNLGVAEGPADSAGAWFGDFPTDITVPGVYELELRHRDTSVRLVTDSDAGSGIIKWDGTKEVESLPIVLPPSPTDNLPRWLRASVDLYLRDICSARSPVIPLLVSGVGDDQEAARWLELEFHGPTRIQYSKLYTLYYLDVFVGCQVRLDLNDVFAISDLQGRMMSALKADIPIYRYGPPEDSANDESFVGCLKLRDDVAHPIDGMDFGIIQSKAINIRRVTVEAQYYLESPSN